jgi:hypothetical protein
MKAEGSLSCGSRLRLASRRNELSIQGFWRGQWTEKRGGEVGLLKRGPLGVQEFLPGRRGPCMSQIEIKIQTPPGQSRQLTLALRHLKVLVKEQALSWNPAFRHSFLLLPVDRES